MEKIKVAVVGYGHLGKWHCQKVELTEKAQLTAIVEASETGQAKAREAHAGAKIFSHLSEALAMVDAVIIVTPTSTHYQLAKMVIEANKHCFCEKPVTSRVQEAKELKSLLENKKLVFQVGHSERCHLAWQELSEYFKALPRDTCLTINRYAPFKGRATDVDVVQDLMIHDIDLLLFLSANKPISVNARGFKSVSDHWDHVKAIFEFKEGIAELTVGRSHVREVRELEVVNQNGTLLVDLFHNQYFLFNAKNSETKQKDYQKRDHLLVEHHYFYDSIREGKEVFVSLDDGIDALYLVEKVLESVEGKKTVHLDMV